MGVAATLHQEITIEKGRVVQRNFSDYPSLTTKELPKIGSLLSGRPTTRLSAPTPGETRESICIEPLTAASKKTVSIPSDKAPP